MELKITTFYCLCNDLGIHLNPVRKKNSKRKYGSFIGDGVKSIRKRIESAFSVIKQDFQHISTQSYIRDLSRNHAVLFATY